MRKKSEAKNNTFKKLRIIFVVLFTMGAVAAVLYEINEFTGIFDRVQQSKEYGFSGNVKIACDKVYSMSFSQIKGREPVRIIPLENYVSPKPDPTKYDEKFDSYVDPTIEVHYHLEVMHDSRFHFFEVKIKHPSQFRYALAYDRYGSLRQLPTNMAADVNAVAAVSASFYNKRPYGVMIYKRKLVKNNPKDLDVLMIDSEGDFHIVYDRDIESSGVLEKYDIVNALSFGPELVHDGKELEMTRWDWEPFRNDSRAAICQYDDKLHYLVCVVEAAWHKSKGITMQTFAHELAAKGVKTAYNLDGGQSDTMVIGNVRKNRISWGYEKPQGDILYFATAMEYDQSHSDA